MKFKQKELTLMEIAITNFLQSDDMVKRSGINHNGNKILNNILSKIVLQNNPIEVTIYPSNYIHNLYSLLKGIGIKVYKEKLGEDDILEIYNTKDEIIQVINDGTRLVCDKLELNEESTYNSFQIIARWHLFSQV